MVFVMILTRKINFLDSQSHFLRYYYLMPNQKVQNETTEVLKLFEKI